MQQQVDDLVNAVRALARTRRGRLVAVTLAVPGTHVADTLAQAVSEALAAAGTAGVEVTTRPTTTAPRVLSVEFAR